MKSVIRFVCEGFDLWMEFDPADEIDCEIMMEAYMLMMPGKGIDSDASN